MNILFAHCRKIFLPSCLACTLALTGCTSMSNLGPMLEPKPLDRYELSRSFEAIASEWPTDTWWKQYDDPQLNSIMQEALAQAPSLAAAAARVRLAEATVRQSGSSLLPQISGNANVTRSYQETVSGEGMERWSTNPRATLDLAWELDFFGRNRKSLEAALSSEQASRADEAQARLTLTASIASSYAELMGQYRLHELALRTLAIREESTRLVSLRHAQGFETKAALEQAESTESTARSQVIQSEEDIHQTQFAIAALMGAGPDRGLQIHLPERPTLKIQGLPKTILSDLLGRRPDVVASHFQTEAAAYRVGETKAAFYPSFNLTALFGLQSIGMSDFIDPASKIASFGPSLTLPIFQGGRLEGQHLGARAEYDEAVANYDATVANALQEVASALTGIRSVNNQTGHATLAEDKAREAYTLTKTRYEGGLATYLEVLTAENTYIAARQSFITIETRAFSLNVSLIKALGGGIATSF